MFERWALKGDAESRCVEVLFDCTYAPVVEFKDKVAVRDAVTKSAVQDLFKTPALSVRRFAAKLYLSCSSPVGDAFWFAATYKNFDSNPAVETITLDS